MLDCDNTRREGWSFWRHLFCVETSNALTHNFTDIYFADQSASTLTPTLIDGFGAKAAEGLYLHTTSYTGGSVGYKAGEPMLAIYSSVVIGAPGNTLANFYLPTRDYGGSCDGRRPVRFMRDVESSETECLFHFTSLVSSCSALSTLDAAAICVMRGLMVAPVETRRQRRRHRVPVPSSRRRFHPNGEQAERRTRWTVRRQQRRKMAQRRKRTTTIMRTGRRPTPPAR